MIFINIKINYTVNKNTFGDNSILSCNIFKKCNNYLRKYIGSLSVY